METRRQHTVKEKAGYGTVEYTELDVYPSIYPHDHFRAIFLTFFDVCSPFVQKREGSAQYKRKMGMVQLNIP